ncbi:MAG: hypothetical protein F6K25_31750, partial [Okeania sp. SIO2G4]|nr:hypothetical protein [Okeania sp. SIO2G4]
QKAINSKGKRVKYEKGKKKGVVGVGWGDGEMGRWGDGGMGRWGDGEMEMGRWRWGDGGTRGRGDAEMVEQAMVSP